MPALDISDIFLTFFLFSFCEIKKETVRFLGHFEKMDQIQFNNSSEDSNSPKSENTLDSLLNHLDNMLDSKLYSDFKIRVKDGAEIRDINVHKIVLSRVTYFKTIFNNENFMESKENQMKIDDFQYAVVMEMLRFIYTTKVHRLRMFAKDLLMAADKVKFDNILFFLTSRATQYFFIKSFSVWNR